MLCHKDFYDESEFFENLISFHGMLPECADIAGKGLEEFLLSGSGDGKRSGLSPNDDFILMDGFDVLHVDDEAGVGTEESRDRQFFGGFLHGATHHDVGSVG